MPFTQADLDALDVEIAAARTESFTLGPFQVDAKARLETLLKKREIMAQSLIEDAPLAFTQTGIKGVDYV